jgi:hypothetical protein
MVSYWVTKHHRWIQQFDENPNEDYFPLAENWTWATNFSGNYRLPWDINFGAFLQSKVGVQGQRTLTLRAADPDGGTPLRQLSTVTVRTEPFGAQQGPAISILNLRASKQFRLRSGQRIDVNLDAFNLLNSSAPTTMTFLSGPTFGWYGVSGAGNAAEGGIVAARVARLGMRYSF